MKLEIIQNSKILIVDDEPANLGVLLDGLGDLECTILLAQDGESALEIAYREQPDLILLDIRMPGMNGFDVCRRLKENHDDMDSPIIIFITALTDASDKVKGFALGAADFITKPFHQDDVIARVATHIGNRNMQQELQKTNERLRQEITERERTEKALQNKTYELGERVKELNCLYGLSQVVETADIAPNDIFESIVELIPPACQYPEITCARIMHDGREYHTENFKAAPWRQTAAIRVHGEPVGCIEAGYLEEKPMRDEGPFLKEERALLDVIAERLGRIIERQQAEEELRLNRQTLDYMAEGVNLVNENGMIVYTNPAYDRMYGYEAGELHARHVSVVNAPTEKTPEKTAEEIISALNVSGYWEGEVENIKKDGTHFLTYARVTMFQHSVHGLMFLTVQEDITQRKRAEEELRQSKEAAEAANRAKSAFLANMSHELRTPLNAILGFAQLLAHGTNLNAEQQDHLYTIRRSGDHLLALINQVLDLSKIEAGHAELDKTNFDLYNLLDETEEMFRLHTRSKGLQLRFKCAPDTPRYIRTDKVKLRQVLINLLNNAMKFTKEGGIAVRVGAAETGFFPKTRFLKSQGAAPVCLQFEISDTGPGIAPDELNQLFEAFVQTQTGRESHKGTGLGLAISKKFLRLMDGEIKAESEVGQGTTFTFQIMAGMADASDIETGKPERKIIALEPRQTCYRMLIADDIEDNRQLLIHLLNQYNFELREAADGQEAVEIWKEWRPHLIWMDIRMPVMDGTQATKRIRNYESQMGSEESETANSDSIPDSKIIAITAIAFEEEVAAIMASGCDDVLRKPFHETDVFKLMIKHLGVRFVYEQSLESDSVRDASIDKKVLTSARLKALPENQIADLKISAIRTDPKRTNAVIDRIRKQDEPLADALARLVKMYRFDIIQELFKEDDKE